MSIALLAAGDLVGAYGERACSIHSIHDEMISTAIHMLS